MSEIPQTNVPILQLINNLLKCTEMFSTWIVKCYPHSLIVSLLSQLLSQNSRNVFHFVEIMQENFLHDKSVAAFIVTEYIQLKPCIFRAQ